MTKKAFYLFVVVTLLFTACQKEQTEEENTNNNASKIIGVWIETHYWDSPNNDWHTWGFVPGFVHEFKDDKTYTEYSSLTNYNNGISMSNYPKPYTFDGEYLVIDGGFKEKIIFSEDGNKLIWENEAKCSRYTPSN